MADGENNCQIRQGKGNPLAAVMSPDKTLALHDMLPGAGSAT